MKYTVYAIAFAVTIILFFFCRGVVLWYGKIDNIVNALEDQIQAAIEPNALLNEVISFSESNTIRQIREVQIQHTITGNITVVSLDEWLTEYRQRADFEDYRIINVF